MDTILVANAGSSSFKFEVFGADQARELSGQIIGKIDSVGTSPRLKAASAEGQVLVERTYPSEAVPDVPAALLTAGVWLRDELNIHPVAVGHRVVHGGPEFERPVLVTEEVLHRLERYIPLAPLHQPHNLAPIRSIMVNRPGLPQVACFDTAFHRAIAGLWIWGEGAVYLPARETMLILPELPYYPSRNAQGRYFLSQ